MLETFAFMMSYVADLIFDLRYGTNTAGWVSLKRLNIRSENLSRAVDHQPTQILPLRRLLKEMEIPRNKVFVDLGCGKGRVLLVAAEAGFLDIRGVEFSSELCELAATNCAKNADKTKSRAVFHIVQSDVADYPVADGDVFFLFNPFDAHVLGIVLQRIVDSLAERERKIWIIYRNPVHDAVFEETPEFSKLRECVFIGSDFSIYTNAVPAESELDSAAPDASHQHGGQSPFQADREHLAAVL